MIRRFLAFSSAFILLLCCLSAANAATGKVTYSGNSGKFIFEPGSSHSPTDLFPDLKDVMPGDSVTQTIRLKNDANNRIKIRLYLRALGGHLESEEFLSQLKLTVSKNTNTIMFEGPAHKTGNLTDWTYLGTLYSGGTIDLTVKLEVPVELDNRFQDAAGYLDWVFYVEELPVESTDPQTGDTIFPYIITLIASGAAIAVLLTAEKKRRIRTNH